MAKRIMVADDDPAILDVLKQILEGKGYEVDTSTGASILTELPEFLPDLLILDIWMSGIDGGDVCKKLKRQKATKHMPVILLSANKNVGKIALKQGANDFIVKPFEMNHLLKKVKEHVL